jgi:hypothetical protein
MFRSEVDRHVYSGDRIFSASNEILTLTRFAVLIIFARTKVTADYGR